jgi:glutaredoxin 3
MSEQQTTNNSKVKIYSTPTCMFCNMAKDFFKKNGIDYVDFDVSADLNKRSEMIELTGQLGVPVIVVNDNPIVGFNEPVVKQMLGL